MSPGFVSFDSVVLHLLVMRDSALLLVLFLKLIYVENRMLPKIVSLPSESDQEHLADNSDQGQGQESQPHEIVIGLKKYEDEDNVYEAEPLVNTGVVKKPCAIVVLNNIQNPNMQSILRRYRYDSNGVLIPSSVQYFIKLPQGESTPLLVPLNDKTFSPLGGFVRYYKEVPPIPHSWQQF